MGTRRTMGVDTEQRNDVAAAEGYAGDVSAQAAWQRLATLPGATLVDVRTRAEWSYVGVVDLSSIGKEPVLLEWQSWPSMAIDPEFVARLRQHGSATSGPLLFLCRSGVRSAAAARAATAAGLGPCFNVADGFEGPLDAGRRRGTSRGWKASGLPWVQS